MGSTSYASKSKSIYNKPKTGSSAGSDREMSGKLRRAKIRRPGKMNEYGVKKIPDYTELAYKEAVSKLRYFLSGNYSPSVRSFGGSASIKNLDESDGDLDKKYGTYNTLAEYKPRPRLTAKYTTLYADSLKNYNPATTTFANVPSNPAPASELAGGANPDVINFIQKQEEYIEQLERESQYCRDELNNLLGKVKEVISENEHLHEAQKNKLISRMFHTYNAGSETDDLDDFGDSTGLDSDHNKMTPSKTRRPSSKTRSTRLEGPNIVFESRIAELEAQLTQSKIDLKKVQEENNENKRKLANGLVDSTCLDGFKRQIDNLQRDKSTLESQISKLKLSLEQRESDFGYKKGSDVVEQQLRDERNNLEAEIRRMKDELSKERSRVRELSGEGARRALAERSAAEARYTAHFDDLTHDLAAQYDNVAKLQLELERQRREENDLKRELSMKNAALDEIRMELKNKTASLQADLAQAYAEKASLEEELAGARLTMERHQRQAKHETNRLNSEIQSLRQRLDRADADLVHSRRENLRLNEQIANLEKEINMKNLTPMSPEKNKKEKEFSSMMESMENKHAKTVAGLESMIQSQNSLMTKLTGDCRMLTDKLDDANRRHKEELAALHRQVDQLGRTMTKNTAPDTLYQAQPTHATPAYRNDEHKPAVAGQNYPGANAARHAPVSRQPSVQSIHDNSLHSNSQSRQLSRQTSRTSIRNEPEVIPQNLAYQNVQSHPSTVYQEPNNVYQEPTTVYQEPTKDYQEPTNIYQEPTNVYQEEKHEDIILEKDTVAKEEYATVDPMVVEHAQYEQNYEQNQEYGHEQANYDPNYAQQYVGDNVDYQNQGYQQSYDQQGFSEGQEQIQGNYEQYDQNYDPNAQQYQQHDPNVQYQGDYQNYDGSQNYQNENENFDNQGYAAQEYENNTVDKTPMQSENKDDLYDDSKRTNSPNDNDKVKSKNLS